MKKAVIAKNPDTGTAERKSVRNTWKNTCGGDRGGETGGLKARTTTYP